MLKKLTYYDKYPKDKYGWVVDFNYLPISYSLVHLLLDDGSKVMGWHQGNEWYSRRLGGRKIVGWKKHLGEY